MNKFLLSLSALSLGLLCSCTSSTPADEEGILTIRIPEFPSSAEGWDTIRYSDLYSEITFLPLEVHPEVGMKDIPFLLALPNQEFVVLDNYDKQIARFNAAGQFLNLIGCKGHARNEYIAPVDIHYDTYADEVLVADCAGALLSYKPDGTFVNKVKLPWNDFHIAQVAPDTLVAINVHGLEMEGHRFVLFTKQGEVLSQYEPYSLEDWSEWIKSHEQFDLLGHASMHRLESNDVMTYRDGQLQQAVRFVVPPYTSYMRDKLKEHAKWVEKNKKSNAPYIVPEASEEFTCTGFSVFGSRCFFLMSDKANSFCGIYDLNTRQCKIYGKVVDDMTGLEPFLISDCRRDGCVYQTMPSFALDLSVSHSDLDSVQTTYYKDMAANCSFVIIVGKMK